MDASPSMVTSIGAKVVVSKRWQRVLFLETSLGVSGEDCFVSRHFVKFTLYLSLTLMCLSQFNPIVRCKDDWKDDGFRECKVKTRKPFVVTHSIVTDKTHVYLFSLFRTCPH